MEPERDAILVVDDMKSVRTMICAMLTQAGYDCVEAADGREALGVLRSSPGRVRLVLCDIRMPGMDGRELALAVSSQWPHLPIVFMSGFTDEPVPEKTASAAFLVKPFTSTTLISAIRKSLETGRSAGSS